MSERSRVLHLSTSAQGGAGIAARRLASLQIRSGMDVTFASRSGMHGLKDDLIPLTNQQNIRLSTKERRASQGVTLANRLISRKRAIHFTPFGLSIRGCDLAIPEGTEVIHAHNIYNLITNNDLIQLSETYKVVVTLHDERLLTNGCHYSLGCYRFTESCRACPQSRLPLLGVAPRPTRNRRLTGPLGSAITFIAPSVWMREQALMAGVPEDRVIHVPNPIDTAVFTPSLRTNARVTLGLSPDAIVIGWQPGKGNATMRDALLLLASQLHPIDLERVRVLSTAGYEGALPVQTYVVPSLQTELERVRFWGACDFGVSATAMDNFPNVVIESLAVGTPFIIADVGGAAEAVKMSQSGIWLPHASPSELAVAMYRLVKAHNYQRDLAYKAGTAFADMYRPDELLQRVDGVYADTP